MALIPEEIVNEIKSRADIVEVVSPYVRLTKRSGDNLFGLCPFHQEKTPSFSVSTTKQIFYCFGCHKGGDAVYFLMQMEGMSYPEALRYLADKLGIRIPEEDETPQMQASRRRRKRQYELQTEAARYFYRVFVSSVGKPAQDYLMRRKIDASTAKEFGLGYAGEDWDGLFDHLRSRGYSEQEIEASGLFRRNRYEKLYDLFRERLIFPIIDTTGRIIAFGGRILDDGQPKYLNSPETEIYHKGSELYALNLAKRTRDDHFLLVEGYMDVLSLHQAGFKQAVACLGTALTEEQASKMARYRSKVILCFDPDRAGQMATERSLDVVKKRGLEAYVLEIPEGLDPDEYIKRYGSERFRDLLQRPLKATDYRLKRARETAMVNGELDLMLYKDKVLDVLSDLPDRVEVELRLKQLALELMVSQDLLGEQLNQRKRQKRNQAATQDHSYEAAPIPPAPYEEGADGDELRPDGEERTVELSNDPLSFNFYAMLAVFCQGKPELCPPDLKPEDFPRSHRPIAEQVVALAREGKLNERVLVDLARDARVGREPLSSVLSAKLLEIQPARDEKQVRRNIQSSLIRLRRERITERTQAIYRSIHEAAEANDGARIQQLEAELQELTQRERELRQHE